MPKNMAKGPTQVRQKGSEAAHKMWTAGLQVNSKGLVCMLVSHTKPATLFLCVGKAGKTQEGVERQRKKRKNL